MKQGVILSLAILTVGCASTGYWPADEWRYSTPEQQGMDSGVLAGLIDYIEENDLNIHSMTIIRNGYVVLDAYWWPLEPGDLHDIASCSKSITSLCVGIALDKGLISNLNGPFITYYPEHDLTVRDGDPEPITVRHLLTMTAGLECVNHPVEQTLIDMQQSPDFIQFALDLPVTHPPGTHYAYNSCTSHLLGGIVANSSGMSLAQFARVNLFRAIGIDSVYMVPDPQGYHRAWGDMRMSPHDMARIGYMMLNKGNWDGRQIVSKKYIKQTTKNHTKDFGPEDGYGYQWWCYKFGSFFATGRGGQRIFVAPILDLVVVTTAGTGAEDGPHYEAMLGNYVVSAIKKRGGILDPNPVGAAELQSRIEQVTRPPEPRPVPEFSDAASEISGKTWMLDDNLIGWDEVSFEFEPDDAEAVICLLTDGQRYNLKVGLDGVPRINENITFVADPRYDGQRVALHGEWVDDEFVLYFNTLAIIDNGTIRFRFTDDSLSFTLFERSFMPVDQVFTGNLKEEL
ncbi:serine hydrolase [candidate division WOR-3 bacterium]|uniref:Serine hydrolase n=1 Tax=candidate division WOR-3 bacterium TaxID=2052148 RepID=A0A9D5K8N0_UNCW3|nr:serine hydrolase [candidate division WOR-3 bacterium]MBD3364381.1 serine hydrolase [candidate division WOR-3 bacterium]